MKSATKKQLKWGCLVTLLCLLLTFYGCELSSFTPLKDNTEDPDQIPSVEQENTSTDTPALKPNLPQFYDRYTGLACDEAISSCRPLSVCIANYDGKEQKGLSYADILIESPFDAASTRIWAMSSDWSKLSEMENVSSVKSYMLPMMNAFSSVCAFAGTEGSALPSSINAIDSTMNDTTEYFQKTQSGGLKTSGSTLLNAAIKKNYAISGNTATLPFSIRNEETVYTPSGNKISSIRFEYSATNKASFLFDEEKGVYLKSTDGTPHVDSLTGEQLSFSNVILLFYNVSYYHTAEGTSFTLDTTTGGNGFCYTGGRAVSITWGYDNVGNLVFSDSDGETLILNQGKTYIGMLKITDSSSVVAK